MGFYSNENIRLPNTSRELTRLFLSLPLHAPAVAPQCWENERGHPSHGQQSLQALTPASLPGDSPPTRTPLPHAWPGVSLWTQPSGGRGMCS